ncbi:hypothetical protein LCGC14_1194260 [marine sediment metagenome]|uniref:Uncharacterized protein n=1 Tax=marine sediment metagenome TaxID=412755 RepID=A0A0F9LN90_9ZZZZ
MPKIDKSEQRPSKKNSKRKNKGFPYKKTRKKEKESLTGE